jgi:hypothetical protein
MIMRSAGMAMMGMVFTAGVTAGVALGAGLAGAALLAKRMMDERNAWRGDAGGGGYGASSMPPPPMPMGDPGPEAPSA